MINISSPIITDEEISAVRQVLESGMIAQGPKVKELETNICNYTGAKFAIAVSNGTAALHVALYALGVEESDEVITTPFTFVATANSILMQRGKVIFADIKEQNFNIDPKKVSEKITNKTKAIMPVDLFGNPVDYDTFLQISKEHNLKLIADSCQSIGASFQGQKLGNIADITAFSFYATKNIMSGEGGIITTSDEEYARRCRLFRHHGQDETKRYEYLDLGYNYRLTDVQAAIAVVQLQKIDQLKHKRQENAKYLSENLKRIKGLIVTQLELGKEHVFHQYTIRITEDFKSSREEFMEYLRSKEVGSGIYYPKPLHLHPHFAKMGYKKGDFPVAELMSTQVLSLPIHPKLDIKDMEYIVKVIQEYV